MPSDGVDLFYKYITREAGIEGAQQSIKKHPKEAYDIISSLIKSMWDIEIVEESRNGPESIDHKVMWLDMFNVLQERLKIAQAWGGQGKRHSTDAEYKYEREM